MTRSGHIFYLLVALQLIGLMSQQVWGQLMDNEPMALVTTTTTTTVSTPNNDILLDDVEQLPDTDLLDQDMEDEDDEADDEGDDETSDDSEDTPPLDSYFGPLGQGDSKDLEQGDELGEELLVEYSDDDDDDEQSFDGNDALMFEDDEAPLDFKNDEQVDLDQLLFDASQKDTTIMMEYDYQQQQQQQDNEDDTNDMMDELLANADDALVVDPLVDDDDDDTEHPDHHLQEQQQQQQQSSSPNDGENNLLPPPSSINNNNDNHIGASSLATEKQSSSRYKIPLFGVLALLILLYKLSNKKQGGRIKCLEKEEKRLPLHTKDLKIPDIAVDCSILVESSTSPLGTTTQPSPTGGHHQLGRRASSSSFFTPRQATHGGNDTGSVGGVKGHARKISLGHPPTVGSPSRWEDKYRQ